MASNPKVNILLSTYNGEKYLSEQLDSLLAQTYPNITICIRDDGSKDNTFSILKNYEQKSLLSSGPKIILLNSYSGQNLGYMQSFWTLLADCPPADYYAFCDQDDFWLPTKIEAGVHALENEKANLPLLYSSSFTYCDENMTFTGNPATIKEPIRFKDVMFYTPAFGFTIMINEVLRSIALSASSLKNIPHDGWCQKIAASMGKFIYDPSQTAKYRRHASTVTYANSNKLQLIVKWIKNDILGIGLKEYHFILKRFYEEYSSSLNQPVSHDLALFMEQPVRISLYFKRLFFPRRLRPSLSGELALRLCFLLSR